MREPILVYYEPTTRVLVMRSIGNQEQIRTVDLARESPNVIQIWVWAPGHYLVRFRFGLTRYLVWASWDSASSSTVQRIDHYCLAQHPRHPDLFIMARRRGDEGVVEIVRVKEGRLDVLDTAIVSTSYGIARWDEGPEPPGLSSVLVGGGSQLYYLDGRRDNRPQTPRIRSISSPELRPEPGPALSYVLVGQLLEHYKEGGPYSAGERQSPFPTALCLSPATLDAGLAYLDWLRGTRPSLEVVLPPVLAQYVLRRSLPGTY